MSFWISTSTFQKNIIIIFSGNTGAPEMFKCTFCMQVKTINGGHFKFMLS